MPTLLTADQILDRWRAILSGPVFNYIEAISWVSFELQPTTNLDAVYRLVPPASQSTVGHFDYHEERTESVQLWLSRQVQNDYDAVRTRLIQDKDAIIAALTRDAFQDSGDYNLVSEGRGYAVTPERRDASFVSLRLTLAINYDAQL